MKLASAGKSWFVVRCNIRSEEKAAHNLRLAGFETYLPRYRKDIKNKKIPHTYVTRELPLMPPYMFVAMPDGAHHFGFARACEGVECFLGIEGVPARVSGKDVERLQLMETDMQFDDTRAARIHRKEEATTRKATLEMKYLPGRDFLITGGPFVTFHAIVEEVTKKGNIRASVNIFGSLVPIEFEAGQLSTAA